MPLLDEVKRGRSVKEYKSPPRKPTKSSAPRKIKGGSLYRPSQPGAVPDKIMKGLGFTKAHAAEGNAYLRTGKETGLVKQFAQKHASKLATAMSGVKLGMRMLGRVSVVAGAVAGAHDIGVATREGMKALEAHSDAKMNARAQKRKYGTVEAATRTRHDFNKNKPS